MFSKRLRVFFLCLMLWALLGSLIGKQMQDTLLDWSRLSRGPSDSVRVIFRSPWSWNHTLWINQGREKVPMYGVVTYRGDLLGIIDYVGKNQSRVRLVTNPHLPLGVRVARGALRDLSIAQALDQVLYDCAQSQEYASLTPHLQRARDLLASQSPSQQTLWGAKGQIQGGSMGQENMRLEGKGFNLFLSDESSDPSPLHHPQRIRKGDLLVTSGLDGIVPQGIPVAYVSHVFPLEEGDFFYRIEAIAKIQNLHEIQEVEIREPLAFDPKDMPPK